MSISSVLKIEFDTCGHMEWRLVDLVEQGYRFRMAPRILGGIRSQKQKAECEDCHKTDQIPKHGLQIRIG
jgi:hypothetical protein